MVAAMPLKMPAMKLPAGLAGRMSLPNPADGLKVTFNTKFKWDTGRLKQQFDAATRRGLMLAGKDVRGCIQRNMSSRKPLNKPRAWRLQTEEPPRLIALVDQPPKDDVVTSWKTRNFPKGFLRQSIESDWDFSSKSVVAGPAKGHKAADLQNLGGSAVFSFVPLIKGSERKNLAKHKVVYGRFVNGEPDDALITFRRRLKPRGFVEKGTATAIATKKMAKHFADQMHGP
jgi:hypothetical protein